jgi:NTE family protein
MAKTAPKTALVLSAGGMFGAYQAGAWKVLAEHFEPDMVVGASIGAINGWAIASRCDPDDLIERWRNLEPLSRHNRQAAQSLVRQVHSDYKPRIEYGAVLTDTLRLRPRLFRGPDLTWQHLAASAAVLGLYPQYRIDGRLYSDGGLLSALPLWAAVEMGAERIIAINALPVMPSVLIRKLVGAIRAVSRFKPEIPTEFIQIAPSESLGSAKDMLYWNRENADRWIRVAQAVSPASQALDHRQPSMESASPAETGFRSTYRTIRPSSLESRTQ